MSVRPRTYAGSKGVKYINPNRSQTMVCRAIREATDLGLAKRVPRRGLGLARVEAPDYRLYERLKAEFVRDFPAATPQEYERAMRVIAEAAGV